MAYVNKLIYKRITEIKKLEVAAAYKEKKLSDLLERVKQFESGHITQEELIYLIG